jgi:type IV secretory pathway VirB3-like protein
MLRVEFEPTIPVLERAKAVHALDRAATVIGVHVDCRLIKIYAKEIFIITSKPVLTNAAPVIYFSGALGKHIQVSRFLILIQIVRQETFLNV